MLCNVVVYSQVTRLIHAAIVQANIPVITALSANTPRIIRDGKMVASYQLKLVCQEDPWLKIDPMNTAPDTSKPRCSFGD